MDALFDLFRQSGERRLVPAGRAGKSSPGDIAMVAPRGMGWVLDIRP